MRQAYKRPAKKTIELTSLLDLLFVMIFVSMIQQKNVTVDTPTPVKKTITKKNVAKKIKKKVVKRPPPPAKTKFAISAIFNFHPSANNQNVPNGTYRMNGSFDKKSGKLFLGGSAWINRPKNYDMVPLAGKIDNSNSMFTGRIEFQGCKQFTLRKKFPSANTPISGTWEGVYDCSQGATGLTLTIE